MRRTAHLPIPISIVASTLASLLALACGSGQDAAKPEAKAGAKTEAKPEAPPPSEVAPEPEAAPEPEPEATPAPAEPKPESHGGELCGTIIPCFQSLDFAGSFVANVTADIEPDGSVSSVSFTGEAPQPVQECISNAIEKIELTDYNGKPGRVHCKKSGQLMGGTQMIMSDHEYEVRAVEGAPAEETKAEDAKAG